MPRFVPVALATLAIGSTAAHAQFDQFEDDFNDGLEPFWTTVQTGTGALAIEEKGRRVRFATDGSVFGESITGILTNDFGFDPASPFSFEIDISFKVDRRITGNYELILGVIEEANALTGEIIEGALFTIYYEGGDRYAFPEGVVFRDGVQTSIEPAGDDEDLALRNLRTEVTIQGFNGRLTANAPGLEEPIVIENAYDPDAEPLRVFFGFRAEDTNRRIPGSRAWVDDFEPTSGVIVDLRPMPGDPDYLDIDADGDVDATDFNIFTAGEGAIDPDRALAIANAAGLTVRGGNASPEDDDYLDPNGDNATTPGDLSFLFESGFGIVLPGGSIIEVDSSDDDRDERLLEILDELGLDPDDFERSRDWKRAINRYYRDEIDPWFSQRRAGRDKRADRRILSDLYDD